MVKKQKAIKSKVQIYLACCVEERQVRIRARNEEEARRLAKSLTMSWSRTDVGITDMDAGKWREWVELGSIRPWSRGDTSPRAKGAKKAR